MLFRSNIFFKAFIVIFYTVYLVCGLVIYKDFGITTDEEFQRYSGFYWLQYVLNFTPFESLKIIVDQKLLSIQGFTLPNPVDFPFYGVIFDLPLALIETIYGINDSKDYFLLRHKFTFIIFFISSIYFYFLLKNRFGNNFLIFLGILLYISSPRIFGDSFFNNKDIIFLSLITISIYYCFVLIDKFNYRNILTFAFFSAVATAARIIGIFIPISFIVMILFERIGGKYNKKFLFKITTLILFYFIILIILWPYLWKNPINNFINAYAIFSNYIIDIKFLFAGNYVSSKSLPFLYIPTWISISTPIFTLFLFITGYLLYFKIVIKRVVFLETNNDIWKNNDEKKDFYLFANLTGITSYLVFFDVVLYNGWRQIYFLHLFVIYFSFYSINYFFNYLKTMNRIKNYFIILFLSIIIINFLTIIRIHPFQSFYLNKFVSKEAHKKYEIDYWGLSGKKFLNELLELKKEKGSTIKIGVASWIPLERSIALLNEVDRNKIKVVGQSFEQADYIFSNNVSEIDKNILKKYMIPKSFEKVDEFRIDQMIIYEIFKVKN